MASVKHTTPTEHGEKIIGINMKKEMDEETERRAASMHLSFSKNLQLILSDRKAS